MTDTQINFNYKGKTYRANIIISIQDDLKVIFTTLNDSDLIEKFGRDIDFQTDLDKVVQGNVWSKELNELQVCILESVKKNSDFIIQKSFLKNENSDTTTN